MTTDIKNEAVNHDVADFHILGLRNIKGLGFAFVSFKENGNVQYANVLMTARQGTGIGIFSAPIVTGAPLQANQQVTQNGYTLVTGVVVDDPIVKRIVLTFANGDVKDVPVTDGHFWFFGQAGTSEADAYLKHMIGVSNQGEIITNHP